MFLYHNSVGSDIEYDSTFDPNPALLESHSAISLSFIPEPQDSSTPPAIDPLATTKLTNIQAFENTSTSVAASQMRNALNNLADTVEDPEEKKVYSSTSPQTYHTYLTPYSSSRPRWTTSSLFSADT